MTIETRPITTIWDLPTPPPEEWERWGWVPLPPVRQDFKYEDMNVVLRPHICWGPMPMMFREDKWIKSDYSMTYPDEAFEPYWKPMPKQPMRERLIDN